MKGLGSGFGGFALAGDTSGKLQASGLNEPPPVTATWGFSAVVPSPRDSSRSAFEDPANSGREESRSVPASS